MDTKKAEQILNRLIDFYRDTTLKSYYPSASHTIKEAEKALDFLVLGSKKASASYHVKEKPLNTQRTT